MYGPPAAGDASWTVNVNWSVSVSSRVSPVPQATQTSTLSGWAGIGVSFLLVLAVAAAMRWQRHQRSLALTERDAPVYHEKIGGRQE